MSRHLASLLMTIPAFGPVVAYWRSDVVGPTPIPATIPLVRQHRATLSLLKQVYPD